MTTTSTPLTETTVCLQVRIGGLGTRAKIDAEKVDAGDMDRDMLHVSKDILQSDELKAIGKHASEIRAYLRAQCLPSLLTGGIYLVPLSAVEAIDAELDARRIVRNGLVDLFMQAYPRLQDEARTRLGTHYDEADYPTAAKVRKAFTLTTRYLSFSTPSNLKNISKALFDREAKKAAAQWEVATEVFTTLLRTEFKKLVDRAAEHLQVDPVTGKKRVFRDSMVGKLGEFFETFRTRNVCDDAELAAMVDQARALLAGVDADTLRTDDQLRAHAQEEFAKMATTLEGMVVLKPSRLISLEAE